MANSRGSRLTQKQTWSMKWPGMIECGGGKVRQQITYRGKPHNKYFMETKCANCGIDTLCDVSNYGKSKNHFCSNECRYEYTKKKHDGNRHIKKRPGGDYHVLVLKHGHHRSNNHGQVYEHILVAEEKLNRKIKSCEKIHHINCVKNDNRPENLYVCKDQQEHFLIHGSLNKCVSELMSKGVLVFDETNKQYRVEK